MVFTHMNWNGWCVRGATVNNECGGASIGKRRQHSILYHEKCRHLVLFEHQFGQAFAIGAHIPRCLGEQYRMLFGLCLCHLGIRVIQHLFEQIPIVNQAVFHVRLNLHVRPWHIDVCGVDIVFACNQNNRIMNITSLYFSITQPQQTNLLFRIFAREQGNLSLLTLCDVVALLWFQVKSGRCVWTDANYGRDFCFRRILLCITNTQRMMAGIEHQCANLIATV